MPRLRKLPLLVRLVPRPTTLGKDAQDTDRQIIPTKIVTTIMDGIQHVCLGRAESEEAGRWKTSK